MAENVFEALTTRLAATFLEALELVRGNEEKVREIAAIALRKAHQDYQNKGRPSPKSEPKITALSVFEKMMEFGDDQVGGAKFLKDHFDEIPEPVKSEVYDALMARYDEFPKEAQTIVAMLGFKCEAGRKRMSDNLERAAAKLPDGKLKRDMIG